MSGFPMYSAEEIQKRRSDLIQQVYIVFSLYGNDFSRETVGKWFSEMCFFQPYRMEIKPPVKGYWRYNETVFKKALADVQTNSLTLRQKDDIGFSPIRADWNEEGARFSLTIPLKLWNERKSDILRTCDTLFSELGGCFGYAANFFDAYVIQKPDANHELYGVSDADMPGFSAFPRVPGITPMRLIVDPSCLPGRERYQWWVCFTSASYMWFGPDFSRFFPAETVEQFRECEENTEISPGYRRICLWDDIGEYNAPVFRERQRLFREELKMDTVLDTWRGRRFIPKDGSRPIYDPTVEFSTKKSTHGGTLRAVFYLDENGRSCRKSEAHSCVEREMNGNTIVWQKRRKL